MKRFGLAYALSQLSDRERVLVLLLAVVAVPLAVAFLVIVPLIEARDRAIQSADEAQALLGWVAAQVSEMPENAGENGASGPQAASTIGLSGIEASLVQAELRDLVSQLSNRPDGGIDLALEGVPFEDFSRWLAEMVPQWGYSLDAFRIESASPGLVHAQLQLGTSQ